MISRKGTISTIQWLVIFVVLIVLGGALVYAFFGDGNDFLYGSLKNLFSSIKFGEASCTEGIIEECDAGLFTDGKMICENDVWSDCVPTDRFCPEIDETEACDPPPGGERKCFPDHTWGPCAPPIP